MKKNLLTKDESKVIRLARETLSNALRVRKENPSDFLLNIACLKAIEEADQLWSDLQRLHLRNKERAEQEPSESSCFGFFKNKARNDVLKEILIIEHIKMKLFEGINIKEAFQGEPRIILLGYNWKEEKTSITRQQKSEIKSRSHKRSYTITFSDVSTLTLNDLSPESLSNAKVQFDEKMKALEIPPPYTPTI